MAIFEKAQVDNRIASINSEIDAIVADLNKISPKMEELKADWDTEAATNYQKRVSEMIATFEGYKRLINEIPATAQMAGQEFKAADEASNIG